MEASGRIRSAARAITVVFLLLLTGFVHAAPPTADEIVANLDAIRRPAKSFKVHLKLTEIRDGKVSEVAEFDILARKVEGYPDFETVTRCLLPESDRGKVLLSKGTSVWLLDPKSSRPVSLAYEKVRSRLYVAYGLTTSFVREYDCALLGVEQIEDAARATRTCHQVEMKAKKGVKTSQGLLRYWVDTQTLQPVRGQIHSASGKLLRKAYYTRYQQVLGELRPTRLMSVSGVERGLLQDIDFSGFAYRDYPAEMFTLEAMAAISKGSMP